MLELKSPVVEPSGPGFVSPAFRISVEEFVRRYASLWQETPDSEVVPGTRFSDRRQRRNERETDRLSQFLEAEVRRVPPKEQERESWRMVMLRELRRFGKTCLGYPEAYFRIIFSREYFDLTREFVRRVRDFDAHLAFEDLFQALRNVWIMGILQLFLERRIQISNSIFAYSMLYPYSDNFLDDPGVAVTRKAELNERFGRRLAGELLSPRDDLERALFGLVGLVESEYARRSNPQIYDSLLAIQSAQEKSMGQQDRGAPPRPGEILSISVEKGGTSVLADGYLVAGELSREEAEFFFGYGVLLQLLDDIQDISGDLERSHTTVFTAGAEAGMLDSLANRLLRFMSVFLGSSKRFSALRFDLLKDLISRNCTFLFLQALALNPRHYSAGFLRRMESCSPVSFSYIRLCRARIEASYHDYHLERGRGIDLDQVLEVIG